MCCEEGKFNSGGTCIAIPVTDCKQYDGVYCYKCTTALTS